MKTQYVDVETTGLDPRNGATVRVVSIDGEARDVWEPEGEAWARENLDPEARWVGHNIKFDLDMLETDMGIVHAGPVFDTMDAFRILTNGRNAGAGLDNVAKILLGETLSKANQKSGWDGMFLTESQLEYAAKDTAILIPLHEKLTALLEDRGLTGIFALEMRLLPVLHRMHVTGIAFDVESAKALAASIRKEADAVILRLPGRLNPRASEKVSAYFGIANAEYDTIKAHHERTGNPVAEKILEFKKLDKKAKAIEKLLKEHVRNGRIHASFTQTIADTGRLSCVNPNLQNQDKSDEVRRLYTVSHPDNRLVIADYSQIELRIAALLSGDKAMIAAYQDPTASLHTTTQTRIFGDPEKMDRPTRQKTKTLSKNINFGLLFGGGHNTLIKFANKGGVKITEEEAIEYKRAFRQAYPGLLRWQERQGDQDRDFVYSVAGRRCRIPRGEGYCKRINHPVQASAADGMKLALILLDKKDHTPLLTVHDEVLVECHKDEAEEVQRLVEHCMVTAMLRATGQDANNPTVPISVESVIATDWSAKA